MFDGRALHWPHCMTSQGSHRQVAAAAWSTLLLALGACVPPGAPLLVPRSPAVRTTGEWLGTTSQGQPIAFSVSQDERVTTLSIGYAFKDCAGTRRFPEISVPTAPNVVCMNGPCGRGVSTYRAFSVADGAAPPAAHTQVNGVFLPGDAAQGQASFSDYEGCGSATVTWRATRR
jgi:hypothetical protein